MQKFLKISYLVLPWIAAFCFGALYLEVVIGSSYSAQQYSEVEKHQEQLIEYIKSRRDYKDDKVAFESLGLISEDQYDEKYKPWLITDVGLVRFDTDGFIDAICRLPAPHNALDCPPEL